MFIIAFVKVRLSSTNVLGRVSFVKVTYISLLLFLVQG